MALYDCSEDMLLQRYSGDILIGDTGYRLVIHTQEDSLVFAVPEGCNAVFDQIVSAWYNDMQNTQDLEEQI